MIANSSRIETRPPTLFTAGSVVAINLYGVVLVIPVLVSMMIISVLQFGLLTFLIPFAAIVLSVFLLPLGFGNPYVARLVRPLRQASIQNGEVHLVQLTRNPRERRGLLAVLEDADDVGFLRFTDSGLMFDGDSVQLRVPYNQVRNLKQQNTGWRGLFAYGAQTSLTVSDLSDAGTFVFAERSSWILPTSRRTARRMYESLRTKIEESSRTTPPERETQVAIKETHHRSPTKEGQPPGKP
jgi:hypothetical protein